MRNLKKLWLEKYFWAVSKYICVCVCVCREKVQMNVLNPNLQINKFIFFKLSHKIVEKQKLKGFL